MSTAADYARALRHLQGENAKTKQALEEVLDLLKARQDTPKWLEDIPGRRVPFIAPINLTIEANSTTTVEGNYTVSTDGPFVVTGLCIVYQKTEGAYQGIWGPASTLDARIAEIGQQHGYGYLFDQPHCISGDWEIIDRGSGRNWQHRPVSSALFAPDVGGVYVLPLSHLFGENSVINVRFTPGVAVPYAGTAQFALLGYKIVQGDIYQP
jgi:hypothetical protein